jgi:uncharacterized membrane protein YhaH (DUF805 family)
MHWMILPYRRYFEFSGRSRRSEYWWFMIFTVVVMMVLLLGMFGAEFDTLQGIMNVSLEDGLIPALNDVGPAFWLLLVLLATFGLVSIIPSISLQIRRLHDLGVSGWWYLGYMLSGAVIPEIPQVGEALNGVMTLGWYAWMFFPGTQGPNRYGDDPKDPMNLEVFA